MGGGAGVIRTKQTRDDLCRVWADRGYRYGAEIGVWKGEFSEVMCRTIPHLRLICVDPWQQYRFYNDNKNSQARLDEAYEVTQARLEPYGCTILRMTSLDAARHVADGSLDFIYIDGNHAEPYISQDLEAWTPKVRAGGMVAGHDYVRGKKCTDIHVADAVDRFLLNHSIENWFLYAGNKTPSFAWEVS